MTIFIINIIIVMIVIKALSEMDVAPWCYKWVYEWWWWSIIKIITGMTLLVDVDYEAETHPMQCLCMLTLEKWKIVKFCTR